MALRALVALHSWILKRIHLYASLPPPLSLSLFPSLILAHCRQVVRGRGHRWITLRATTGCHGNLLYLQLLLQVVS